MNRKKEMLDEELEENCNKTNGPEDNHIKLTVSICISLTINFNSMSQSISTGSSCGGCL